MNPTDQIIRDATFCSQLEVDFNRCCNARLGREQRRMSEWEKKFVSDMMRLAARDGRGIPRRLRDRQIAMIRRIAAKFEDVIGL